MSRKPTSRKAASRKVSRKPTTSRKAASRKVSRKPASRKAASRKVSRKPDVEIVVVEEPVKKSRKKRASRKAASRKIEVEPVKKSRKKRVLTLNKVLENQGTNKFTLDLLDTISNSELKNKSVSELRKMLDDINFVSCKPTRKDEIIGYIESEKENGRCSPVKDKFCSGDLVCDASNDDGICIDKSLADIRDLSEITYHGKRIIGCKSSIKKLESDITNKVISLEDEEVGYEEQKEEPSSYKEEIPSTPERINIEISPMTTPESPPPFIEEGEEEVVKLDDGKMTEGDVVIINKKIPKLKEGSVIIKNLGDIDDILRRIKENKQDENSDFKDAQMKIASCVGLLS